MKLHSIIKSYYYEVDINEFKELIKTFDKNVVINKLYIKQFGYPSIQTLSNTTGYSIQDIKDILHSNEIYTQFKKPQVIKDFRTITSEFKDDLWSVDLFEMTGKEKLFHNMRVNNNGYYYILNIIDTFTRYVWSFPLQNKDGKSVSDCFNSLSKQGLTPNKLWVDRGTEFYNKYMNNYCNKYNVHRYSTQRGKEPIVERFNRTMKEIMWKYFVENNSNRWIDIHQDIVNLYNNRFHRTLQMTPSESRNESNFDKIASEMSMKSNYYQRNVMKNTKSNIGDKVRKILNKQTFQKGYKPKWSKDVYEIIDIVYDSVWFYIINDNKRS